MDNRRKVLFIQKIGENEYETESLWCEKKGKYYIVDNIPFIAKNISLGDTIQVEHDLEDNEYYFEDMIEVSGNTTIRILVYDNDIEKIRKWLKKKGCESEVLLERKIIAVNIPKAVKYLEIKSYLDQGENNKLFTYQESALEHDS